MNDLIDFDNFKKFWEKEPIVVIDSSSLLDLYRYAPNPAKRILENLNEIKENIWIPSHVIDEYTRNKPTVISKANKKYENVAVDILDILKNAENNISTKFIRYGKFKYKQVNTLKTEIEATMKNIKENVESFKEIVAAEIRENKQVLKEDELQSFIQSLKDIGNIGTPLSLPNKIEIYKEGKVRYDHLIPPGYKDIDKDKSDKTKTEKFGDLIIWKELLQKARENERPFIFITDDEKEDWWELKKQNSHLGEKVELIGPRHELISEFNEVSRIGEGGFVMLTMPEFNKHISSFIDEINCKEMYLNELELDPTDTVMEIINSKDWHVVLEDKAELTYEFNHGGELQEMTGEILTDVEIVEILDPEFDSLYVDYNEDNNVVIVGSFNCVVSLDIETSLSKELYKTLDATVVLSGNITIEFIVDYDEVNNTVKRRNEEIDIANVEIIKYEALPDEEDYSNIACVVCEKRPGIYITSNSELICPECSSDFEACSRCGIFYDEGILNGYLCDDCIRNED